MMPARVRRPLYFTGAETGSLAGHDALSTTFVARAFLFFVVSTPEAQGVEGQAWGSRGEPPGKRRITRRC